MLVGISNVKRSGNMIFVNVYSVTCTEANTWRDTSNYKRQETTLSTRSEPRLKYMLKLNEVLQFQQKFISQI